MKLSKAIKRDNEINRRRYGQRTDGKSVFQIEYEKKKRADKAIKELRRFKEELLDAI